MKNTSKKKPTNKPEVFFTPEDNVYRHICYVSERGEFRLTMPGRNTTYHGSLSAAQRARDEALNGPPEPAPTPISPQLLGYFDHERFAQ